MKRKDKAIKFFGGICAAAIALSTVLFSACSNRENAYRIPDIDLPTAESFALKKYDYENLSDVQTTVRADKRNVLQRNLPRAQTQLLSDDFSIVYDTASKTLTADYGALVQNSDTVKTATIHFDKYPAPNLKGSGLLNSNSVGYGSAVGTDGSNAFSNGTMNGASVSSDNGKFYKYMLMTQGQHLAAEAAYRSQNGTLTQEWLKKHPAADAQYGAVLGENNAVKKEITLDPIYRSYHATGLYLPAGEAVTVKVEGLKAGERISVVLGVQDSLAWRGGADNNAFNALTGGLNQVTSIDGDKQQRFFTKADVLVANGQLDKVSNQSQWDRQNSRLPWLHAEFTFTENKEYTIGTPFGGAIEIGMENCYSRAKTTFTGAVEMPHYVLGQTTPEYFDEYLRDAPGVIAILDTENGQLIGPTGEMGTAGMMRQVKADEIDKLAMLWHSFFSVNESFTGGTYNRFNKTMFDWHVPAGAAVALGNYSFAHPTGWFSGAMNYRGLLSNGTWGILHEVGHNHASSYGTVWGFQCGQEGEVRNNALILLSYIMFCDIGTTVRNSYTPEHGEYANPYNVLNETIAKKGRYSDPNDCGYFEILGMYANIMHSFGAEKFYELLYTYKGTSSYCANKRADFAYRCSLAYGMNFIKYFNDFYAAGIKAEMFSEEQLSYMQPLPNYEPVSCFYAGGIDGVKTAGDYIVTFGDDVTFDLLGRTVSSLDTAEGKGFEILRVNKPEHGTIREAGAGKWGYSFDKNYTGVFDTFTFDVKLSDGIVHTLSVTLRISYNGGRITAYNNVQGNHWDEILNEITQRQPDAITGSVNGAVPAYQTASGKKDVRISEFYWRAPESGEVSLSAKWDDWAKVYFGESFDTLEEIISGNHDIGTYQEYNVKKTVEKGKYYAVKIVNVNTGGGGSASFAYRYDDNPYTQVQAADAFHPAFPLGQEAPTFVYEPQFLISKKDNIKLSSSGTDKSEWTVVSAPENIVGGRYETQQLVDPDTGKPLEGEGGILKTDKWSWLIDGQTGTNLHTTYGGGDPKITPDSPHVFVVDTSKTQSFNFFSVTTRNNVNSYITDFEVQISDDLNGEWTTLATGDRSNYSGTNITVKFDETTGRYLKLIVKGTTGGNFSVLAEIDAGIQSSTQQVFSPTGDKLYATDGWKNSAQIAEEANGFLIAEKTNEKLVVRFVGDSFALYGATGENYGTADVYIDGAKSGSFDLDENTEDSRKLIFYKENLDNKEHTVEIITTSAGKVMLSVLGIPYSGTLVNAPNIYKENALTVSLVVFVLLFAAVAAFLAVLVFVPKFREKVFGSRLVKHDKIDGEKEQKAKKEKPEQEEQPPKAEKLPAEKAPEKTAEKKTDKAATEPSKPKATAKKAESAPVKAAEKKPAAKATKAPEKKPTQKSKK